MKFIISKEDLIKIKSKVSYDAIDSFIGKCKVFYLIGSCFSLSFLGVVTLKLHNELYYTEKVYDDASLEKESYELYKDDDSFESELLVITENEDLSYTVDSYYIDGKMDYECFEATKTNDLSVIEDNLIYNDTTVLKYYYMPGDIDVKYVMKEIDNDITKYYDMRLQYIRYIKSILALGLAGLATSTYCKYKSKKEDNSRTR